MLIKKEPSVTDVTAIPFRVRRDGVEVLLQQRPAAGHPSLLYPGVVGAYGAKRRRKESPADAIERSLAERAGVRELTLIWGIDVGEYHHPEQHLQYGPRLHRDLVIVLQIPEDYQIVETEPRHGTPLWLPLMNVMRLGQANELAFGLGMFFGVVVSAVRHHAQ